MDVACVIRPQGTCGFGCGHESPDPSAACLEPPEVLWLAAPFAAGNPVLFGVAGIPLVVGSAGNI